MAHLIHPFPYNNSDIIGDFWRGYDGQAAHWREIAQERWPFMKQRTKTFNWGRILSVMQDWTNSGRISRAQFEHMEYSITRSKYGLNLAMDEEDINDDMTDQFRMQIEAAGAGWPRKQNVLLASLMDGADSTNRYDGVPFYDVAHPGVDSTGTANTNSNHLSLALNKPNLVTALTTASQWFFMNGEMITPQFTKLVVPSALFPEAVEIMNSPLDPTVATGRVNFMFNRLTPVHFPNLTDTNKWFLIDDTGAIPTFFWSGKQELRIIPPVRGDEYQKSRELEWSVDASGAFGFTLWFTSLMSEPS